MIWGLTPPRQAGGVRVAVLWARRTQVQAWGGGLVVAGGQAPVAVLFAREGGVEAHDLAGRALDVGVLEGVYPGLRAAMTAAG